MDDRAHPPSRPPYARACCDECVARLAALSEQVGEVFRLPSSSNAEYHTTEQVIGHLNKVLGPENWSYRVLEHGRDDESDEMWALCELIVSLWLHGPDGETYTEYVLRKQDAGAQQIKRHSRTKLPISLGDDRKGAISDAVKRCARLIGVGLYLWMKAPQQHLPYRRSDDEEEARAATGAPRANAAATPAGAPRGASVGAAPRAMTRGTPAGPEQQQRFLDLLSEATAAGFAATWTSDPVERMSAEQLAGYSRLLSGYLAKMAQAS
jgi:hypothetical protein